MENENTAFSLFLPKEVLNLKMDKYILRNLKTNRQTTFGCLSVAKEDEMEC